MGRMLRRPVTHVGAGAVTRLGAGAGTRRVDASIGVVIGPGVRDPLGSMSVIFGDSCKI
jgi:hypothetical protein